jgi:hypothetical protein
MPATTPGSKAIDSWAMIAWAADEPGAVATQEFFDQAESGGLLLLMSVLNAGETFYILAKRRGMAVAEAFLKGLPSLQIQIDVPGQDGDDGRGPGQGIESGRLQRFPCNCAGLSGQCLQRGDVMPVKSLLPSAQCQRGFCLLR